MTRSKRHKINLHDLFLKGKFDHGVICTYTFDPFFFEDYCLDKFTSISENGNLSVMVDRHIYDEFLLDKNERPKQANIRYLLVPIQAYRTFHPKIVLLASKRKGMLVIGSANFTRAGITSNAELVGAFYFELNDFEDHLSLFIQAFKFIQGLVHYSGSNALASNVRAMAHEASWLTNEVEIHPDQPRLLHNLSIPLFDQLLSSFPNSPDRLTVLSRFFDGTPTILDTIQERLAPKATKLYTQNGLTTLTANWYSHPSVRQRNTTVLTTQFADEGHSQPLHAKLIAVTHRQKHWLAYGSANFTSAALTCAAKDGNIETLLLLPEIDASAVDINAIVDPLSSCQVLSEDGLRTAASKEKVNKSEGCRFEISEAALHDQEIVVYCREISSFEGKSILVELSFAEGETALIKARTNGATVTSLASEDLIVKLRPASTLIRLKVETPAGLSESNAVILVNLQDFVSGNSVRKERFVREAQESPSQFASILSDLLAGGDENAILSFLNFCDIPLDLERRRSIPPSARVSWVGADGMRTLGTRNLEIYRNLHDASLSFAERHLKRLMRHCSDPEWSGAGNFLHIANAITGVLHAQIERLVAGLSAVTEPLAPGDWYQHRQQLDIYLNLATTVVSILAEDFLPELDNHHHWSIPNSNYGYLRYDIESLKDLIEHILSCRERIDSLRKKNLCVIPVGATKPIAARYFKDNVLHDENWVDFDRKLRRLVLAVSE